LSSDQDMEDIDNISLNSFDVDSSREISGLNELVYFLKTL